MVSCEVLRHRLRGHTVEGVCPPRTRGPPRSPGRHRRRPVPGHDRRASVTACRVWWPQSAGARRVCAGSHGLASCLGTRHRPHNWARRRRRYREWRSRGVKGQTAGCSKTPGSTSLRRWPETGRGPGVGDTLRDRFAAATSSAGWTSPRRVASGRSAGRRSPALLDQSEPREGSREVAPHDAVAPHNAVAPDNAVTPDNPLAGGGAGVEADARSRPRRCASPMPTGRPTRGCRPRRCGRPTRSGRPTRCAAPRRGR